MAAGGRAGPQDDQAGRDRRRAAGDRQRARRDGCRRAGGGQPDPRPLRQHRRADRRRPHGQHQADAGHDDQRLGAGRGHGGRLGRSRRARRRAVPADAAGRGRDARRGRPAAGALHPLRLALGDDRLPDRGRAQHPARPAARPARGLGLGAVPARQGARHRRPPGPDRPGDAGRRCRRAGGPADRRPHAAGDVLGGARAGAADARPDPAGQRGRGARLRLGLDPERAADPGDPGPRSADAADGDRGTLDRGDRAGPGRASASRRRAPTGFRRASTATSSARASATSARA